MQKSLLGFTFVFLSMVSLTWADQELITFTDDGGWCWFEDERAIVHNSKLIIGTVADGRDDPARRGNIEVVTYDLDTGETARCILHERLQRDDHDSPALLVLGDGRILAMYSKHGNENKIYYRISCKPSDGASWQDERVFVPSKRSRVTYTNLFRLQAENDLQGRIYNFYRGYDNTFKPSWITSDNEGKTWQAHGLLVSLKTEKRHRPYVKYTSNGTDTIHFVFTEGHPRTFDNSIYHAYYKNNAIHRSDGTVIKKVNRCPIVPSEATRVFHGDADNVAWTSDLHLDDAGRPVVVYSVQKNSAGLESSHQNAGRDHRYHYARWDGERWRDHEIAYAGTRLYPGEGDYTGNICIDPDETNEVYLSSNVDIHSGRSNTSGHYEIYRGVTCDHGKTWEWKAITENSKLDNIRPVVPHWNKHNTVVLWLRGKYNSYTDYDLDVVGVRM